jgi:hypothetical protein
VSVYSTFLTFHPFHRFRKTISGYLDLTRVVNLEGKSVRGVGADSVYDVFMTNCRGNLPSIVELFAEPLSSPAALVLLRRSLVPDFREGVHDVVLAETPVEPGARRIVCKMR